MSDPADRSLSRKCKSWSSNFHLLLIIDLLCFLISMYIRANSFRRDTSGNTFSLGKVDGVIAGSCTKEAIVVTLVVVNAIALDYFRSLE